MSEDITKKWERLWAEARQKVADAQKSGKVVIIPGGSMESPSPRFLNIS